MEKKQKILRNVVTNTDEYTWHELDCVRKPVSIAMSYYGNDYRDLYLLFVCAYKFMQMTEANSFGHYKDILGVDIKEHQCDSMDTYTGKIIDALDNEIIVVAELDSQNIYYDNTYFRKAYHLHRVPVKGYNRDQELFYVLDNLHRSDNKPIYIPDVIPFDLLWKFSDCGKLITIEKVQENIDYNKVLEKYLNLIAIIEKEDNFDGMNDVEVKKVGDYQQIIEKRKIYYEKLIWLLEKLNKNNDTINLYKDRINKLVVEWLEVKELITKQIIYKQDYSRRIAEYVEHEKKLHRDLGKLINTLGKIEICNSQKEMPFQTYNSSNAHLFFGDYEIKIVHKVDRGYNLWEGEGEAPQISFHPNKKDSVSLEANICSIVGDDEKNLGFQSGIFVELLNGVIFLFGLMNKKYFCIVTVGEEREKFVAYESDSIVAKIEVRDGNILFLYKQYDEWEVFDSIDIECGIKSIGLFSRTWGTNHLSVTFRDVILDGHVQRFTT